MNSSFITIAEAVTMTSKSRRTIQRLVESLLKNEPDQVMKEKTNHGYIWRINEQRVRKAYGLTQDLASVAQAVPTKQTPVPTELPTQPEKLIEVALQGYAGMMAMHQEVKQVYEERLRDKEQRIAELTNELELAKREPVAVSAAEPDQSRRGLLGWLWGE
jgi:hypothetical protein